MNKLSTRNKILEYLSSRKSATVLELSGWLSLTKADIRYQLKLLVAEGMVKRIPPSEFHPDPGRPSASFFLVSKNLPPVVSRFLDGFGSILTDPEISDSTREFILISIIQALTKDFEPRSSGTEKLNEIIVYLESLGFKARWETGNNGPKIIIFNNPAAYYLNNPLMRYDGTEKLIKILMSK